MFSPVRFDDKAALLSPVISVNICSLIVQFSEFSIYFLGDCLGDCVNRLNCVGFSCPNSMGECAHCSLRRRIIVSWYITIMCHHLRVRGLKEIAIPVTQPPPQLVPSRHKPANPDLNIGLTGITIVLSYQTYLIYIYTKTRHLGFKSSTSSE